MSRILLFLVFALWSIGVGAGAAGGHPRRDLIVFCAGYGIALLAMAVWGVLAARRVPRRGVAAFNRGVSCMRYLIVAWFAVGIFLLHWPAAVETMLGRAANWPIDSPRALLGTLPAVLAWIGLIAVQYPTDRAVREQNITAELLNDLPIHQPPTLLSYLEANLRLEVLFTLVPLAMILLLRDAGSLALLGSGRFAAGSDALQWADAGVSIGSAALVFLTAPLILRRVLHTRPLAASELRRRLETMCRNAGLRYREILLWHTDNHMGNAAVMGVVPMVRYILLSDLLLETMSDRQIEAVFAHELGHVAHRHLTWSGLFVVILLLAAIGPGKWVGDISSAHLPAWAADIALPAGGIVIGLLLLLRVLRFFERQADVYAARTIEWINQPAVAGMGAGTGIGTGPMPSPAQSHVGEYGAAVFGSALHRVAVINNIPLRSRTLTHGSIADRIEYLRSLSTDPALTRRFDRFMVWVYATLLIGLTTCAVWSGVTLLR